MGYGLREVGKMKAVGKFVVTESPQFSEVAHLPVVPVNASEPWKRNGHSLDKPDLAIMFPASGRYCPPEMHFAMGMLEFPDDLRYMQIGLKGVRRDVARTEMVKKARAVGAEFGLMLDDDNPPPSDTVVKLLHVMRTTDAAVVAGIYSGKAIPAIPWVFRFKDNPEGFFWNWKAELRDEDGKIIREGEVFECDAIASGCMMIRLSVFDHLKEPWFYEVHTVEEAKRYQELYKAGDAPRNYYIEVTDDMFFCHKVKAAGFKIMAHGGVLPGHWDENGNCYRLAEDSLPMR